MGRIAYSYIRFSTSQQAHGDSFERQMSAVKRYCNENNLTLSDQSYKDFGVSGYRSKNVNGGNLGFFVQAVKSGKISAGSYLIIENLDRLSRDNPINALSLLMEIIELNISLVILQQNLVVDTKSINENPYLLYAVISEQARAHQESKLKSERVRSAKKRNLELARQGKTIFTKKCPAWMEYNEEKKKFELIDKRAKIVERIYQEYLIGSGSYKIASSLNQHDIEPFGRSTKWNVSYIKKILANPAVIGIYEPHELVDGVRVPLEPIENYYPVAVEQDLFDAVQMKRSNNSFVGGRTGLYSNLFTKKVRCGYCDSNVVFMNKGTSDAAKYLVCNNSKQNCKYLSLPYKTFEESFLKHVKTVNINDLIDDSDTVNDVIHELKQRLKDLRLNYDKTNLVIDNVTNELLQTNDESLKNVYRKKSAEASSLRNEIEKNIKMVTAELKSKEDEILNTKSSLDKLNNMVEKLKDIDVRKCYISELGYVIEEIVLFPGGDIYDVSNNPANTKKLDVHNKQNLLENNVNKDNWYYQVYYRSGKNSTVQGRLGYIGAI